MGPSRSPHSKSRDYTGPQTVRGRTGSLEWDEEREGGEARVRPTGSTTVLRGEALTGGGDRSTGETLQRRGHDPTGPRVEGRVSKKRKGEG